MSAYMTYNSGDMVNVPLTEESLQKGFESIPPVNK